MLDSGPLVGRIGPVLVLLVAMTPVSNLSNVLARHPFDELGLGTRGHIALLAAPARHLLRNVTLP